MYKVIEVPGGFRVVWQESQDAPQILADGRTKPYPYRQGAYRKAKKLNDAVKQVDEVIARDGAIIL